MSIKSDQKPSVTYNTPPPKVVYTRTMESEIDLILNSSPRVYDLIHQLLPHLSEKKAIYMYDLILQRLQDGKLQ